MASNPGVTKPWYGRLRSPDQRDRQYLMRPRAAAKRVTRKTWGYRGPLLDQGATFMCVGFSCFYWLRHSPSPYKPPFAPQALYEGARRNDEWPGEGYEGSSVRGGFQFLHMLGFIERYEWAFDSIEPVIDHLSLIGPVVMGTDWYLKMDKPDRNGYIWPEGGTPTGHAWLLNAVDRERKNPDNTRGSVTMIQSWGEWGANGRARLTFQALEFLLKAQGEAGVAVKVKVDW